MIHHGMPQLSIAEALMSQGRLVRVVQPQHTTYLAGAFPWLEQLMGLLMVLRMTGMHMCLELYKREHGSRQGKVM